MHRRDSLANKDIRLSCFMDKDEKPYLRIIETYTFLDVEQFNPAINFFFRMLTDVFDYLRLCHSQFIRRHYSDMAAEIKFTTYRKSYVKTLVDDPKHQRNEIILNIPNEEPALLILIGMMEIVANHMQYRGKSDGFNIQFYFDEQPLSPSEKSVAKLFADSLSKLSIKHADILKDTVYSSHGNPLLAFINRVYPSRLPEKISQLTGDRLYSILLNSNLLLEKKTQELVSWLKDTLAEKSNDKKSGSTHDKEIHRAINRKLENLEILKIDIWQTYVMSVIGMPAFEGDCYTKKHPELTLLQDAVLTQNENGLFLLDYTQTHTYKKEFADKKSDDPDQLKQRIIQIFNYLQLTFIANQDFHGPVMFTRKSSDELMRRGFNWSKQKCRALLVSARLFKQFTRPKESILTKDLFKIVLSHVTPYQSAEEIAGIAGVPICKLPICK